MTTNLERPSARPLPPTQASLPRRILHLVIALAGWALFIYWWTLVLGRVGPEQVRLTVIFIVVTLVVSIVGTGLWSLHNLRIWKRRGPRMHVREVREDYTRDCLGRNVTFKGSEGELKNDRLISIGMEHEGKVYRPSTAPRSRVDTSPWAPVKWTQRVTP